MKTKPKLTFSCRAWLAACGLSVLSLAAHAQTFPVTVGSCGEKLTFTAPPKAALIHDINMTDMALSLGLQSQMAGVSGITGWYKMSPEFKQALGNIKEIAPKQPSLENILALQPDFFFAGWNYGMAVGGEVTPTTLKKYKIPTLVLSESCIHVDKARPPASMELLYADYLKLGTIFGKEAQAKAQIAQWKQRLAALPKATGKEPLRMFLFDSGEDKPFTAGKFAIPTAMMAAVGGRNIMDDVDASWGTVAWEAVAARNPEFLVLLDYQNDGGADKLLQFLQKHPLMQHTTAVKNKRFVALRYEELTPGPANVAAIEKMARAVNR